MPRTSAAKASSPPSGSNDTGFERLHKRIAGSGLCSRRAAEALISQRRVQVNGETVVQMGVKVGPEDEVRVDGAVVSKAKVCTLIMNKPLGYLTTLSDPQRRPTVSQLLPDLGFMVKPVGRLDMDTDGILVFTNDGTLAHRLTHPRYGVEKEYQVTVKGVPEEHALERLRKGIWIEEGGKTAPATVEVGHLDRKGSTTSLRIVIHEGRKRQVRLMCEAVGHEVITLRRVRFGPLVLKNMPAGSCRMLGIKEVDQLKRMVGLDPHFNREEEAQHAKSAGKPALKPRTASAAVDGKSKARPPRAGRPKTGSQKPAFAKSHKIKPPKRKR